MAEVTIALAERGAAACEERHGKCAGGESDGEDDSADMHFEPF